MYSVFPSKNVTKLQINPSSRLTFLFSARKHGHKNKTVLCFFYGIHRVCLHLEWIDYLIAIK